MSNLCIIPARGGSKRIPRKNIKDFLGKPIISYSIEESVKSNLFDEIMVSTDDLEVKEVAEKYGAKVPFMRSKVNSDDYASTMDVLKEVIFEYEKKGIFFEYVCCLYPCSPLTTSKKILEAYELIENKGYDSVFPVMLFSFPIQRAVKLNEGKLSVFYPDYYHFRSQDLGKSYHDAGQFYFMKEEVIRNYDSILTDNTGGVEISELEGQDIDGITDWKLAELKYSLLRESF